MPLTHATGFYSHTAFLPTKVQSLAGVFWREWDKQNSFGARLFYPGSVVTGVFCPPALQKILFTPDKKTLPPLEQRMGNMHDYLAAPLDRVAMRPLSASISPPRKISAGHAKAVDAFWKLTYILPRAG